MHTEIQPSPSKDSTLLGRGAQKWCPPTFRFGKTIQHNPTTPTIDHKNKRKSAGLMDGYYVIEDIVIPHPCLGVMINNVSKEDIAYHIIIGDLLQCTCPDFTKLSSQALTKKGKWVYCKDFYHVFRFLGKGVVHEWQVHSRTYVYLQQGHVTIWTCWCCRVVLSNMFKKASEWHVPYWFGLLNKKSTMD